MSPRKISDPKMETQHALDFQRILNEHRRKKNNFLPSPSTSYQTPVLREPSHFQTQTTMEHDAHNTDEMTLFSTVARVVSFSPNSSDEDGEMDEISLINNTSQITDRSPSPPGDSFASRAKRNLQASSPPGFSLSHPSPPGDRLDDDDIENEAFVDSSTDSDGMPWAMIGTAQGFDIPALLAESLVSTPESTPIRPKTNQASSTASAESTPLLGLAHESPSEQQNSLNVSSDSQQSQLDPPTSSKLDAFRVNEVDLALSEQATYLTTIQELQKKLDNAHFKIEQLQGQSKVAESPGAQNEAAVLLDIKSPKTPQPAALTPTRQAIWDRNQTLVKEIRFADQTCVEVSHDNESLRQRLDEQEDRLQDEKATNERLVEQVREATQLIARAQTRSQHDAERIESLEQERLQDKETIHRLQQELQRAQREVDSKNQRVLLAEALQKGLAEAHPNHEHVELAGDVQQQLAAVMNEKAVLKEQLELLETEHAKLQRDYDSVKIELRDTELKHKIECGKMAVLIASAVEAMSVRTASTDQILDMASLHLSDRLLTLTEAVSRLKDDNMASAQDHSSVKVRGSDVCRSPESDAFFSPTNGRERMISPESTAFFTPTNLTRLDASSVKSAVASPLRCESIGDNELDKTKRSLHSSQANEGFGHSLDHFSGSRQDVDMTVALYDSRIAELTKALDSLGETHGTVVDERDALQRDLLAVQAKTLLLDGAFKAVENAIPGDESNGESISEVGADGFPLLDAITVRTQNIIQFHESVARELARTRKENDDVATERDVALSKEKALTKRVNELLQSVEVLQLRVATHEDVATRHDNLQRENDGLAEEHQRLSLQLAESQSQIIRLQEERDALLIVIRKEESLERRNAETDALCISLRTRVENLEDEILARDAKLCEISKDMENAKLEVAAALKQLSDRDARVDALNVLNTELRQDADHVALRMKDQLDKLSQDLEEARWDEHQLKGQLSHMQKQCTMTETELLKTEEALAATMLQKKSMEELVCKHMESLANLVTSYDHKYHFFANDASVPLVDRLLVAVDVVQGQMKSFQSQIHDVSLELTETKALLVTKEAETRSSVSKAVALQEKVDKLKYYARKLRLKCDEWEAYSDKQSTAIVKLKSHYHQARKQAMEAISCERAIWESERQQFSSYFEDIQRALLDMPVAAIFETPSSK